MPKITRHDMLVELASDQVNQVQQLLDEHNYESVHSWLQPMFLRNLQIALADMSDDDLETHYCDQLGVDIPSGPPLSSEERAKRWSAANVQEKDTDQIYSQAEESERRSVSITPSVDTIPLSLLHSIRNATSVGEVATEGPVPSESEAPVHWY